TQERPLREPAGHPQRRRRALLAQVQEQRPERALQRLRPTRDPGGAREAFVALPHYGQRSRARPFPPPPPPWFSRRPRWGLFGPSPLWPALRGWTEERSS